MPQGGFESFEKRCREAKNAFAEAWKLRPDDARTAEYMLDLEKSIGGDRAEMERWFERVMVANPDSLATCWTKLDG